MQSPVGAHAEGGPERIAWAVEVASMGAVASNKNIWVRRETRLALDNLDGHIGQG